MSIYDDYDNYNGYDNYNDYNDHYDHYDNDEYSVSPPTSPIWRRFSFSSSHSSKPKMGSREKLLRDIAAKIDESKDLEERSMLLRERADSLASQTSQASSGGDTAHRRASSTAETSPACSPKTTHQHQFTSAAAERDGGGGAQAQAGANSNNNKNMTPEQQAEAEAEAEKLRREAYELEQKAKTLIRSAARLQNGVYQGGATGAGIGAGVAGGLGTLVGGLVGGVAAIPTTGLGMLIGAGAGAVHGPWVKLVKETVAEEEGDEGQSDESESRRGSETGLLQDQEHDEQHDDDEEESSGGNGPRRASSRGALEGVKEEAEKEKEEEDEDEQEFRMRVVPPTPTL